MTSNQRLDMLIGGLQELAGKLTDSGLYETGISSASVYATIVREAIERLTAHETSAWRCKAQRTADPPQDCDWPHCGCDPHADKVLAALQEEGWAAPNEAEQLRRIDRAARIYVGSHDERASALALTALEQALFDGRPAVETSVGYSGPEEFYGDNGELPAENGDAQHG